MQINSEQWEVTYVFSSYIKDEEPKIIAYTGRQIYVLLG